VLEEGQDDRVYQIVRNDEEQYSIWLIDRDLPIGWHSQGITGNKTECLEKIAELWTDLRPLSLRVRHESAGEHAR
jgi:MbtH protein